MDLKQLIEHRFKPPQTTTFADLTPGDVFIMGWLGRFKFLYKDDCGWFICNRLVRNIRTDFPPDHKNDEIEIL